MSERAGLKFPASRIRRYLRKGQFNKRLRVRSAIYITAILEYVVGEILQLAVRFASLEQRTDVTPRDIMLALKADKELQQLMKNAAIKGAGIPKGELKEASTTPLNLGRKRRVNKKTQ